MVEFRKQQFVANMLQYFHLQSTVQSISCFIQLALSVESRIRFRVSGRACRVCAAVVVVYSTLCFPAPIALADEAAKDCAPKADAASSVDPAAQPNVSGSQSNCPSDAERAPAQDAQNGGSRGRTKRGAQPPLTTTATEPTATPAEGQSDLIDVMQPRSKRPAQQ